MCGYSTWDVGCNWDCVRGLIAHSGPVSLLSGPLSWIVSFSGLEHGAVCVDDLPLPSPLHQGAGTTLGWSIGQCAWMAVAIAGGCSIFTIAVIMPFLRKRLHLYLVE